MEKKIGKVVEVFIPEEDNDFFNVMTSNKIGFKVALEDEILEIIEEQSPINVEILKNDLVVITKQTISGVEFTDIEPYGGEMYE